MEINPARPTLRPRTLILLGALLGTLLGVGLGLHHIQRAARDLSCGSQLGSAQARVVTVLHHLALQRREDLLGDVVNLTEQADQALHAGNCETALHAYQKAAALFPVSLGEAGIPI